MYREFGCVPNGFHKSTKIKTKINKEEGTGTTCTRVQYKSNKSSARKKPDWELLNILGKVAMPTFTQSGSPPDICFTMPQCSNHLYYKVQGFIKTKISPFTKLQTETKCENL